MGFMRRLFSQPDQPPDDDPTINPARTSDLYRLTAEGYIIAQDIACQYDYANTAAHCPTCGSSLRVAAQLNRAAQGLNEMVCLCTNCGQRHSLIFDVSNDVYQLWLAGQLGDLYIRNYEGEPRRPV